jgi:HK97 family phage major capsid protein
MDEQEKQRLIAAIKELIGERLKEAGIDNPEIIKAALGRLSALEQIVADRGTGAPAIRGLGIANPFEADDFKQRVKAIHEGDSKVAHAALKGVGIRQLKALVTLPSGGTSGFPTQPQRGPTLDPAQAPLTLVDVLPSTPVTSDSYEFVQITRVNNAGMQQNEGDQKPETEFDANLETAKIATVAHWTQASRQVLADNAQLSAMLSRVLSIDVVAKYENLLLNGNGTTDKIHGLVPQATPFAHTKVHKPDRVSECLAAMWAAGYVGSVVIMNPFDWSDFETERADAGDGQYVAGGWANPAAPTVWRTPVARAAGLAQGSALVVDTRFVTMLDRQQVTTAVSAEDRDNFIKNLITMLAEMRGGLAVYNTDAVRLVDLAST